MMVNALSINCVHGQYAVKFRNYVQPKIDCSVDGIKKIGAVSQ